MKSYTGEIVRELGTTASEAVLLELLSGADFVGSCWLLCMPCIAESPYEPEGREFDSPGAHSFSFAFN
jgi:hypothetical protein